MGKQTFTAGQVLTAAEMNSLQENDYNWTVTTKTASYTLAAGDEGTRIVMNNAGATTITVDDAIFSAGDVVWIHNIGAGTCTITAGTATVNTDGSLALEQYQGGQLFFTSASSAIFFPNVGAQAGGKILQVVSTTKTDTFSATVSAGSGSAITGLTASITPSSTASKVLAFVMVSGMSDNSELALSLTRGGTAIAQPASPGSRTPATSSTSGAGGTNSQIHATITYLDSPASVSALTYGVDFMNARSVSTVVYVNRSKDDTNNNDHVRSVSSITLMEVSA